jgi:hypothetical protein
LRAATAQAVLCAGGAAGHRQQEPLLPGDAGWAVQALANELVTILATQNPITTQAVGAYGEKAAEAELLRRGWIPANVNASIRNAADFDLIAQKQHRIVLLRVKACQPKLREFQFGTKPESKFSVQDLKPNDYTILVSMGAERYQDEFYIVPTSIVRNSLNAHIDEYLQRKTRKGNYRKDTGQWTLRLRSLKSGEDRHSHGYEDKWAQYRENWAALDTAAI